MKSRIFFTFLYITLLLAMGCGSKHKVVTSETKVLDSVVYKVETVKAPLITDVLKIKELCKDSVATEFRKVYVRDTDTITVYVEDNALTVEVNQKERTISELEQKLKTRESEIEVLKSETKYKTHWGLVFGFLLAGFVIGLLRPWRWFI